jgi:glycosyltransferase involved in cell wall biosynthesis
MRKRPHSFLGLAKFANLNGIDAEFIIYGADGGELESIQNIISTDSNIGSVTYLGALSPNDVQKELGNCDLLVLPSENEPFPMVVLESLSVGTPVLIMPSSGIADLLSSHHPEMVAKSDSDLDLSIAFANLLKNHLSILSRSAVQNTCRKLFDLDKVVDVLEFNYRKVLRKL